MSDQDWDGDNDDLMASNGCPTCGGPLKLLGRLGRRTHYRCENCGADSSAQSSEMAPGYHATGNQ